MRNIAGLTEKFKALPAGLTVTQIANQFGVSHNTARDWARLVNYTVLDGRLKECWEQTHPGGHAKADWTKADWTKTDPEIAMTVGVSRARVWQKRRDLNRAKAETTTTTATAAAPAAITEPTTSV